MALLEARPDSDGYPPVNPGKTSPQNKVSARREADKNIYLEALAEEALKDASSNQTINERFIDKADRRPVTLATSTIQSAAAQKLGTKNAEQLEIEIQNLRRETRKELRLKTRERIGANKLPAVLGTAKGVVSRARATAINVSAFSWGSFLYLCLQLPFALLGAVAFGVMSVIDGTTGSIGNEAGFWTNLANTVVEAFDSLVALFSQFFIEIAGLVFTASYVLVMAVGFITLFALYLQYTIGLLRPLSGTAMGLKYGVLLLAIIGYSIPFVNLLPWALAWMVVVWFFPR